MENAYNNLCQFNFGKHCYVVMKNVDKVMYFESVDGKYVMPITNFNLYDNQGKSLTLVNQHFFMNQLVNRLNIAFKKGFLFNDEDLISYLNDLKKNSENDVNLKRLFKGSLMSEINEKCFDKNKSEILKYLDKFRVDTFVDYNNVSIFNGSLEKNSSDIQTEFVKPVPETSVQNFDFNGDDFSFMGESLEEGNMGDQQPVVENVSSEEVLNGVLFDQTDGLGNDIHIDESSQDSVLDVNENSFEDKFRFDVFDSGESTNVNNNESLTNDNFNDQVSMDDGFSDEASISNFGLNNDFDKNDGSNNIVQSENDNVDGKQASDVFLTQSDNISLDNNGVSNDLFGLSSDKSNISYIDEVKDRMNTGYNKSEVSDVVTDVSDVALSSDSSLSDDNGDKKGRLGIILFSIFLVVILGILSFYLYKYVF